MNLKVISNMNDSLILLIGTGCLGGVGLWSPLLVAFEKCVDVVLSGMV